MLSGHQHVFALQENMALTLPISGCSAAYNFSNGLDMWPRETSLKAQKYRGENVLGEEQDRTHFINEEMQPGGGGDGGSR